MVNSPPSLLSIPPCRSRFDVPITPANAQSLGGTASVRAARPRQAAAPTASQQWPQPRSLQVPVPVTGGGTQERGPVTLPGPPSPAAPAQHRAAEGSVHAGVGRFRHGRDERWVSNGDLKQDTHVENPGSHWDLCSEGKNRLEIQTLIMHTHPRIELMLDITLTSSLTSFFCSIYSLPMYIWV